MDVHAVHDGADLRGELVLRLVTSLAERGHAVSVCIQRTAEDAGDMSDEALMAVAEQRLDSSQVERIMVSDTKMIPPAEATISTSWRTADTVAQHHESLFKFYFAQDEPQIGGSGGDGVRDDYDEMTRSYALPLRHIGLGASVCRYMSAVAGVEAIRVDVALETASCGLSQTVEQLLLEYFWNTSGSEVQNHLMCVSLWRLTHRVLEIDSRLLRMQSIYGALPAPKRCADKWTRKPEWSAPMWLVTRGALA